MTNDQTKSIIPIIILVVFTVGVVIYSNIDKNKKEEMPIEIVVDYSDYYTVNSCLNNVINYITSENADNLYLLITEDYKKDKNITKENVLSFFKKMSGSHIFVAKKMYYQAVDEDITKYYVFGYAKSDDFSESYIEIDESNSMYFIVYLDSNEGIYSIEPYDGAIFIEGENHE